MKAFRWVLLSSAMVLMAFWGVQAQEPPQLLTRGTPVLGAWDDAARVRTYFFVGVAGERVVLQVSPVADVAVGLFVSDAQGTIIGQTVAQAGAAARLEAIVLPSTGNYYATVFTTSALEGERAFELLLLGDAPTAEPTAVPADSGGTSFGVQPTPMGAAAAEIAYAEPQQVLLANGIEVRLAWDSSADMNLEVRDPLGNSLYWDNRTIPNGGTFGFDVNGFCQIITPNPVETATWQPGFLLTGNYEILVFYRQPCDNAAAPVSFTVTVTVNGQVLAPIQGTLLPPQPNSDSVYLASFRVNADTSATLAAGGIYPPTSLNQIPAPIDVLRASAQPLTFNSPVRNAIYGDTFYHVYAFSVEANELVTVSLNRVTEGTRGGSLDTLLQIVDSNGNLVAVNDDANNSRDSQVRDLRLANAGVYYAVATRYGKNFGGTEGTFELTLARAAATIPQEIANLNLAAGDLQVVVTWSTNADLQLLVRDPVGDSVYDDRPAVDSGGRLLVNGNINCRRMTGTPYSHINWGSGLLRPGNYEVEVWYQNPCGDTTPVEFTLVVIVDGQLVAVERQRPTPDQRYILSFTVNPDRTAVARLGGYASNDSSTVPYADKTPQPINLNVPVAGTISDSNVFDVYALQGSAGQTVTISMAANSTTLDTKLFLISPSGVQVAENDDANAATITGNRSDALIANYTLQETGVYLIVATRFATIYGGTIGGYTLTVQGN